MMYEHLEAPIQKHDIRTDGHVSSILPFRCLDCQRHNGHRYWVRNMSHLLNDKFSQKINFWFRCACGLFCYFSNFSEHYYPVIFQCCNTKESVQQRTDGKIRGKFILSVSAKKLTIPVKSRCCQLLKPEMCVFIVPINWAQLPKTLSTHCMIHELCFNGYVWWKWPLSAPPPPTVQKEHNLCLQLCRKCTFSVHFCALLYRQRPACQLHVWVFLTKGIKVYHLKLHLKLVSFDVWDTRSQVRSWMWGRFLAGARLRPEW